MRLLFPVFVVGLVLIVFYFPAFFGHFFQDDFLLLKLARGNPLAILPHFPFRPVAIQLYFGLGLALFGQNPFGFHLLLFLFFLAGLYFAGEVTRHLFPNEITPVLIFYAANVSLFPLFYWVATSYFTLALFFFFASLFLFLQKSRSSLVGSILLFAAGLLSNEIILVTPVLFCLFLWLNHQKIPWRKIAWFVVVDLSYLLFRLGYTSAPLASDYRLDFSLRFLATFRWYFLRLFNLPEGIKIRGGAEIYFLFEFFVFIVFLRSIFLWQQGKFPGRYGLFALAWFFVGALPFFFIPGHMSAYYLTLSLFGPAVFLTKLFDQSKLLLLVLIVYLGLSLLGLSYLAQTHWIILRTT